MRLDQADRIMLGGREVSRVYLGANMVWGNAFSPASLFAQGEPGVWYDPSDFSTLFQDSAGATPVTAVERPVGLMLDKSKGLTLGPERSGGLETGALSLAAFAIDSGETLPAGVKTLQFTVVISSYTSGSITIGVGAQSISANRALTLTGAGAFTAAYTIPASETLITYRAGTGGFVGTIDNISVRELPGNHAYQTIATSRPVLSARVNQYLATETLATQNVTTLAAQYRLRFGGTGTITLSGTATGVYSAGLHLITCMAGTLTSTVSGLVTKADLRVANDGANLPPYQRVNTATDYDTAGFPHYLRFDGVDDWLVTPTITPGTDKVQVFAGVRRLRSVTAEIIAETGVSSASRGAFYLVAESSTNRYGYAGRGNRTSTPNDQASLNFFPPPDTAVLTATQDINGNTPSQMRRNVGAWSNSINTTFGGGNFQAYPLYIGRRAGTSFPFNGHIYSLIVRFGNSLPIETIEKTEAWINGKTGAY